MNDEQKQKVKLQLRELFGREVVCINRALINEVPVSSGVAIGVGVLDLHLNKLSLLGETNERANNFIVDEVVGIFANCIVIEPLVRY